MVIRGYTLIELLTQLAVGAILLTLAIPGFSFLMNASQLASVTNTLVASLQLARSEAIKRGERVTICKTSTAFSTNPVCDASAAWQQGWLIFVDGDTRGVIDPNDILLHVQNRIDVVATITANNYSVYISYLSRGTSQGSNGLSNGTMKVCVDNRQRDIIINNTGRIRLISRSC